jgi:DNA-binding NarL/FixJ family response regulator
VDDHPAVREGLTLLLEQRGITVCGDAEDGAQALNRLESARPDVVLVDLSLQRENGVTLIEQLHMRGVTVLVYSMHEDAVHVKRAFAAGANGYVTKREGADILVHGIREVIAGRRYLSERTRNTLIDGGADTDSNETKRMSLSDRELLVLQSIGEGDSTEEIARRLHISARTVETYCSRIMAKIDLAGMKELRRYAIQQGHEGPDLGKSPS